MVVEYFFSFCDGYKERECILLGRAGIYPFAHKLLLSDFLIVVVDEFEARVEFFLWVEGDTGILTFL